MDIKATDHLRYIITAQWNAGWKRWNQAKVTRLALQNAATAASLLLTTEVIIAEAPKDEDDTPVPAE